jgi:transglutaminase-like putative cysteine protease
MAQISFDELFKTATRPVERHERPLREEGAWYTSWEEWLTFSLVLFVLVPVIGSLQSAQWVSEMPSLLATAGIGVTIGWLMAHSRLNAGLAALAALGFGVGVVLVLVMHTMRLADPLLGEGARARWDEFWLRLNEWSAALVAGGISTDPLPFVVLLIGAVFAVAFMTAWAVVRWRNPWAALIPGGFVLLTNISYLPGQPSFSFIVYLLAAVLLVTRLQFIQAALRWRRDRVEPPDFMSIEVLSVATVVGLILVVFAWVVPTANHWGPVADTWGRVLAPVTERVDQFGQLFIGVGSKKGVPVHAFGATLPIQGKVTLDEHTLMEVIAPEPMNLRGAVYDEYTGTGWKISGVAIEPLLGTTVESAGFGTPETRAQVRTGVITEVTIVADDAPVRRLLAPGEPLAADQPADLLLGRGGPIGIAPTQQVRPGTVYRTAGTVSAAAVGTLQEAGTDYPPALYAAFTQLPADLPPEVVGLARTIVGDAATPYEAARRIETYLRQNFVFDLDIAPPAPRQDAVAHFLFDQQRGYFDHFATAMAVMLRSVGIPTRVAVGFALDEATLDATTKAYLVSERGSWAWPEVYFPNLGWVEFNPTPARGLVARPGDDRAARDAAAAARLTDPDFEALLEELLLGEIDPGGFGAFQDIGGEAFVVGGRAGQLIVRTFSWLLVLSMVGFVILIVARVLWERSFRGLSGAPRRWAKATRLAGWAGLLPPEHATPAEVAERLGHALSEPSAMRALARSYTRLRYGREKDGTEPEEEARMLDEQYRRVRGRLYRRIMQRISRGGAVDAPLAALPRRHTQAPARR